MCRLKTKEKICDIMVKKKLNRFCGKDGGAKSVLQGRVFTYQ